MKITLNKLFLIILFILNVSCKSGSNITDPPPINNSECIDGESMGCDDICSTTPLQNDACGECGEDGSICEGLWNVFYVGSVPIAGFQFNIDGALGISASGGAAEAAGFMVSASSTSPTVIGFSLSGSTIPPGTGTLINLEIIGDSDSFCISDLILSDVDGNSIDDPTIEDCNTIKYSD